MVEAGPATGGSENYLLKYPFVRTSSFKGVTMFPPLMDLNPHD
jgi:hypothetical protein